MEVFVALGVPKGAPFFTTLAFVNLAGATTVGIRFVAVSAIVTEALVMWAVLPADGANARVALLAVWVAKGSILLFILGAGR